MSQPSDADILTALQRGLPIDQHPFQLLGDKLGITEEELLEKIKSWMNEGKARRLGGVFDARRLGYKSALCAIKSSPDTVDEVASLIVPHPGITHCYVRGWPEDVDRNIAGGPHDSDNFPNLWFTFAVPADEFDQQEKDLRESVAPAEIRMLPAIKRFKIDVIFDQKNRDRSETFPGAPIRNTEDSETQGPPPVFSDQEKQLINILSNNIPICHSPFQDACDRTGFSMDETINLLKGWKESGALRRMAIILRHRKLGFKANAMCTWHINPDEAKDKGRILASFPEVTHCYERDSLPGFPYNVYAMIHTQTWEGTSGLFEKLSDAIGIKDGRMLCSIKEYKKTSMNYFA